MYQQKVDYHSGTVNRSSSNSIGYSLFKGLTTLSAGIVSFVDTYTSVPNIEYIDEAGAGVGAIMPAVFVAAIVFGGLTIAKETPNTLKKAALILGTALLSFGTHEGGKAIVSNLSDRQKTYLQQSKENNRDTTSDNMNNSAAESVTNTPTPQ